VKKITIVIKIRVGIGKGRVGRADAYKLLGKEKAKWDKMALYFFVHVFK